MSWTGITKKQYPNFSQKWYMDTGQNICLFLFTSVFVVNIRSINVYIQELVKRFYDRGMKFGLK